MKNQLSVNIFIALEATIAFLFRYFESPAGGLGGSSFAPYIPVVFILAHYILQKSSVSRKIYFPKDTPFFLFTAVFLGVYTVFLAITYIAL